MSHTAVSVHVQCPYCDEDQRQPSNAMRIVANCVTGTCSYAFTCISCDEVVCKFAEHSVSVLKPIVPVFYCGGIPELLEEHSGPPISHDDVLAFHEELRWWQQ